MLIEDCEDLQIDHLIPDLEKIYNSGKDILKIQSKALEVFKNISDTMK